MSSVDVTVFLPCSKVLNAKIPKDLTGEAFRKVLQRRAIKLHTDSGGQMNAIFSYSNRLIVMSKVIDSVEYEDWHPLILMHNEVWLPPELSNSNSIEIMYSFLVRVRIRGAISSSGGANKAFLKDVEWQFDTTFEQFSEKIGSEWQLFTVKDEALDEMNVLEHILYKPSIEKSPPAQRQLDSAAKRDPATGIASPSWCYPIPVILCAPRIASYSSTALPVLLSAVDIPQLESLPSEVPSVFEIRAVEGKNTEVLNTLIQHGSAPLYEAIKQLDNLLSSDTGMAEKFTEVLNITYSKLTWANRGIKPESEHNEATHRLVIHEFLAATVELIGDSANFSVEKALFSETSPGALGYGPLDMRINNLIFSTCNESAVPASGKRKASSIGDGVSEEEMEMAEQVEIAGAVDIEEINDALRRYAQDTGKSVVRYPVVEEEQLILDDGHFAQAIAGGVDVAIRGSKDNPDKRAVVYVCLCTAHRYLYFSVSAGPLPGVMGSGKTGGVPELALSAGPLPGVMGSGKTGVVPELALSAGPLPSVMGSGKTGGVPELAVSAGPLSGVMGSGKTGGVPELTTGAPTATRPLIKYLGDVRVSVLRMTYTMDGWIKEGQKVKKGALTPSHSPVDCGFINREDVELVLKAMVAVTMNLCVD